MKIKFIPYWEGGWGVSDCPESGVTILMIDFFQENQNWGMDTLNTLLNRKSHKIYK